MRRYSKELSKGQELGLLSFEVFSNIKPTNCMSHNLILKCIFTFAKSVMSPIVFIE